MIKKFVIIFLLSFSTTTFAQLNFDTLNQLVEAGQYDKALNILNPLVNKGDADAQNYLGWMYDYGRGVKQDYAKAVELYTLAANQGHDYAQKNLGWMYYKGYGVKQDYEKAVELYILAANQGNAEAQINLGWMYQNGQGVKQDYAKAVELYTLAANQGHAEAQNNLGGMYENGQGAIQSYDKAAPLYHQAATNGSKYGMRNLGLFYRDGKIVQKNLILAHAWLNLAASGTDAHPTALDERDEVQNLLNQKQLAQAQKLATNWKVGQKLPNVAFKQDKSLLPKTIAQKKVVAASKEEQGVRRVTCQNKCVNGSCIRTFSDGRTEHWQAPQAFNPITQQFEWDVTTNACGI